MSELSRRLDVAAARSVESLLAAHAHLAHATAVALADRIYPMRTIELYCDAHGLDHCDAAWIRIHALARVGLQGAARSQAATERRMRAGILRFHDWMRLHLAPQRDPVLRELLQYELAHSRSWIMKLHVRNAVRFAAAASPDLSTPVAVSLYLDRLHVDDKLHAAVHAMALDRLGAQRKDRLLPAARQRIRRPAPPARMERKLARAAG
ncbi:hypothetical protein BH23GEM9_BH23GEM9_23550 [soil metagenome]